MIQITKRKKVKMKVKMEAPQLVGTESDLMDEGNPFQPPAFVSFNIPSHTTASNSLPDIVNATPRSIFLNNTFRFIETSVATPNSLPLYNQPVFPSIETAAATVTPTATMKMAPKAGVCKINETYATSTTTSNIHMQEAREGWQIGLSKRPCLMLTPSSNSPKPCSVNTRLGMYKMSTILNLFIPHVEATIWVIEVKHRVSTTVSSSLSVLGCLKYSNSLSMSVSNTKMLFLLKIHVYHNQTGLKKSLQKLIATLIRNSSVCWSLFNKGNDRSGIIFCQNLFEQIRFTASKISEMSDDGKTLVNRSNGKVNESTQQLIQNLLLTGSRSGGVLGNNRAGADPGGWAAGGFNGTRGIGVYAVFDGGGGLDGVLVKSCCQSFVEVPSHQNWKSKSKIQNHIQIKGEDSVLPSPQIFSSRSYSWQSACFWSTRFKPNPSAPFEVKNNPGNGGDFNWCLSESTRDARFWIREDGEGRLARSDTSQDGKEFSQYWTDKKGEGIIMARFKKCSMRTREDESRVAMIPKDFRWQIQQQIRNPMKTKFARVEGKTKVFNYASSGTFVGFSVLTWNKQLLGIKELNHDEIPWIKELTNSLSLMLTKTQVHTTKKYYYGPNWWGFASTGIHYKWDAFCLFWLFWLFEIDSISNDAWTRICLHVQLGSGVQYGLKLGSDPVSFVVVSVCFVCSVFFGVQHGLKLLLIKSAFGYYITSSEMSLHHHYFFDYLKIIILYLQHSSISNTISFFLFLIEKTGPLLWEVSFEIWDVKLPALSNWFIRKVQPLFPPSGELFQHDGSLRRVLCLPTRDYGSVEFDGSFLRRVLGLPTREGVCYLQWTIHLQTWDNKYLKLGVFLCTKLNKNSRDGLGEVQLLRSAGPLALLVLQIMLGLVSFCRFLFGIANFLYPVIAECKVVELFSSTM